MSAQTPNLLESTARGLKGMVVPGTLSGAQQRQRGVDLIKQLVTGGLALGAGTGLGVALANRIKSLKEEEELENESILNDDTLYIPQPKKMLKRAFAGEGPSPWLAPGLGLTGGLLGAGGAYAMVQALWNKIETNRRRKLVDEAQNEALAASDAEAEKFAAAAPAVPPAKLNFADLLTAFPVAAPLLTALAAGGVTYATLDKSFPVVKKPKNAQPKRVRLVAPDGSMQRVGKDRDGVEEEETEKAASERRNRDLDDAGGELLVSLVTKMGGVITADILHRAAKGGLPEMEETFKSAGFEAVSEIVKGAAFDPAPDDQLQLGAMALMKSAGLAPSVKLVAASEFIELAPHLYAMAASNSPRTMEKLAGLAGVMGLVARADSLPELAQVDEEFHKQAAAMSPVGVMDQDILALLQQKIVERMQNPGLRRPAVSGSESEERDAALTSDAAGGIGGEAEEDTNPGSVDDQESQGTNDVVDDVLAAPNPEQVLAPTD